MSNTTKFLMSVFIICILTISTMSLQAQISKPNDAELPIISQHSDADENTLQVETLKKRPLLTKKYARQHIDTLQNERPRVEIHKKRPLLIKKYTRQHVDTKKQVLPLRVNEPLPVNDIIPSIQQVITEVQTFLHPMHLDIVIRRLMDEYNRGKIDLEYVVEFFESQHHYEPAILEKLEPRRAFKYFDRIVGVSSGTVNAYAENLLAKDPDNPDAQAHMVLYEKDNTKAAALYRKILIKHPNHPTTLSGLGYRLLDHSPEEALQYLKKANLLDPTLGLFGLGREYERLGDVKTAWFCYKKSITIRNRENREKERFPLSRICVDYPSHYDESNLYAIEGGKYWKSAINLVPNPNENTIRRVLTFQSVNAQQKREIQEFYQFRDWVRNIENMPKSNQNNDFLVIEIKKHLNDGKPMFDLERIVRAYETTIRLPGNDGIQLLKKTDPEVAWQILSHLQKE